MLAALCLSIGCAPEAPEPESGASPIASPQQRWAWAGTAACLECHAELGERWRGSDHDLAMQEATSESVLGDFGTPGQGTSALLDGQRWGFASREGAFFALPPQADGRERQIAYTFGVRPLQQYLVRGDGGRLQPLPVAWDSREAADGGQRWIHLYEGEGLRAGDPLHWAGRVQTWNHQCADCHSTGLERGYDEATDRYDTRWQELDVGCEACHGRGSQHIELARDGDVAAAREAIVGLARSPGEWVFEVSAPIARRSLPATHTEREVDSCAPCHSRRARIALDSGAGDAFLDGHLPALLDEGLYFADGRMRDEVYVWGSFVQSRMYAAGVSCGDCHDPHSLEVRGGPDGVCASCHEPTVFATRDHHGHGPDSAGASCVACHMPERTFMQIDARRDHSLRVPRPDIAAVTGSPSVCTPCHEEGGAAWAAAQLAARGALRKTPHPGSALAAARAAEPGATAALVRLIEDGAQPTIARATAASMLGSQLDREGLPALRAALDDPEALVRLGAVRALAALAPADRLALGLDRLRDPARAVRIEAARALAAVPPEAWEPGRRSALTEALREYRHAQEINADRVEAQLNLSNLESQLGDPVAAIERARRAVRIAPDEAVPRVNLADLLRRGGNEIEAEEVLRKGLSRRPGNAELELSLGLSLVRQGRSESALSAFARAYDADPDASRVAYTYAIALQAGGRVDDSIAVLERSQRRNPRDRELLYALSTIERDRGRLGDALRWAEALLVLDATDARSRALRDALAAQPR